jgi:hypothetical protein
MYNFNHRDGPCYNFQMSGHPNISLFVYAVFAILVIFSVVAAMPEAFSFSKNSHKTSVIGAPLPPGQHRFNMNETISIEGIPFTLTRVASDDRCTTSESCQQKGHAILVFHVNTSATEEDITVDSDTPTVYTPFLIRLVSLSPTPATGEGATEAVIEIINTSTTN